MLIRSLFSIFIMRYLLPVALAIAMVAAPAMAAPAFAEKAEISMLYVSNTSSDIRVYSKLEGAFTEEILEAIDSGIPTTFTYYIELKEKKRLWRDDKVVEMEVRHSVKYDALKKEYLFDSSGGGEQVKKSTKKIDELKDWLVTLNGVPIAKKGSLYPGDKYYVKLKAEIKSIKLVFPLNYLFFFFSFLNFDTSWKRSATFTVQGAG